MFEQNFQDKAHVRINNEVFFSGTSEMYKTFLVLTDLLECVYLGISIDLRFPGFLKGQIIFELHRRGRNYLLKRVNSIITNRKSIHCIYSSLIETKI